jgi:hypothetical protein
MMDIYERLGQLRTDISWQYPGPDIQMPGSSLQ